MRLVLNQCEINWCTKTIFRQRKRNGMEIKTKWLKNGLILLIPINLFLITDPARVNAQSKINQIEILPYTRMDWYHEFIYSINPTYNYFAKIKGISWGLDVNYKLNLNGNVYLKIGTGYYRYAFNKIRGKSALIPEIKGNSRIIIYPNSTYYIFSTKKYWYHSIPLNLSINKIFEWKNQWRLSTGLQIKNYYTFSQTYYINGNGPPVPQNNLYKPKNDRYFGLSVALESGLLKKIGDIYIGPVIIIPVFDMWKQDEVFPKNESALENSADSRHKWFRGIGVGISVNFALGK